jgi:hypothetical protein
VRRWANLEVVRVVLEPVGVVVVGVVVGLLWWLTPEFERTTRKAITNATIASGANNRAALLLDRALILSGC